MLQSHTRVAIAASALVAATTAVPRAIDSTRTGASRVVRAVPNAAADVGKSYTPWTASSAVTNADRALVRRAFDSCGTCFSV